MTAYYGEEGDSRGSDRHKRESGERRRGYKCFKRSLGINISLRKNTFEFLHTQVFKLNSEVGASLDPQTA